MIKVGFLTLALAASVATAGATQTGSSTAQGEKPKPNAAPSSAQHVAVDADSIKWGSGPASLPPGAQMAVLDGDPGKAVPFVIRAKLPDGYRVGPHFHPTAENVTVVSGTFLVGMGDTFSESSMKTLGTGGFAKMPKGMHHYAMTKGETVIQVHGVGPFAITYVNPNDDPRNKAKTSTK
jgi:quercetin dioxygenase-like cupin family protein